jgi:tRNA-binding protein
MIDYEEFISVDMRVGTIKSARINELARNPAYVLEIDFGDLGTRTSSAQITKLYSPQDLVGRQVICVINFPPKQVAGVRSEVLLLGVDSYSGIVLLSLDRQVANGQRVY